MVNTGGGRGDGLTQNIGGGLLSDKAAVAHRDGILIVLKKVSLSDSMVLTAYIYSQGHMYKIKT